MGSFLNKIVMPITLVGCLFYVYYNTDNDAGDSTTSLGLRNPALTTDSQPSESTVKLEVESQYLFGGYPCVDHCSEHLAGYYWAQENGTSDPDNCDGQSAAFIEGCRIYAENRAIEVRATN